MLVADKISKTFHSGSVENRILKNISIKIDTGQFICVVGRSGSGKSTFLNILSTLLKPDKGSVVFEGQDITTLSENKINSLRQRDFAIIFQFHHLMPYLTVTENVLLPYMNKLMPVPKSVIRRAEECIDRVGLGARRNMLPGRLSGGEQQRVAVARALVKSPEILFADEPTGNLDKKTGDEIISLMKNLNNEGLTIIMVTHELSYISCADRVVVIEDGVIKEVSADSCY